MENYLFKEEWIEGNVMMSPRPEYNHMKIMRALSRALEDYFKDKCEVAVETALFLTKESPIDIKRDLTKLKSLVTAKRAELSPDIAVYCDREQIFRRGFLGVPQLVIEVLSPSNALDDTVKKKDIYEKFGVPEYWIADPSSKEIIIFGLENETYKLVGEYSFLEEEVKSNRLEGLIVNIKNIELYENDEF